MLKTRCLAIGVRLALAFVLSGLVHAQSTVDTFEAPTLNPFWTLTQQYGTVHLSTDKNHTFAGKQSLKFVSSDGGQRNIFATHKYASPLKGTFSISFYDVAPNQETQYEQISLYNSVTGDSVSIGTQDFDAYCYEAQLYNYNTKVQQGPNQRCGTYPQTSTTNVHRTAGWHILSVFVGSDSITLAIDGNAVFTGKGNYSYNTLQISQSGPVWRPDTYSYWDDFAGPVW